MDGPRHDQTKWIKSERERQVPHDITYMWNLKYDRNKCVYETETDSETQTADVVAGERVEEGWIGSLGLAHANY